jgi:predicted ThiF/HesA family dinucleotide-utilizing enzyme
VRVFYSHAMKLYGSATERREISLIEKRFVGYEVVDPSALQAPKPGRETEYYLEFVDSCDVLVFSRHYGNVTDGVKQEVDHAISKGKPVYELRDGKFIPVTAPVINLPMRERIILRAKGALGMGEK